MHQLNDLAEGSEMGKLTAKFEKDLISDAVLSLGDQLRASDGNSSIRDANVRMSVVLKTHPQLNSKFA